MKFMELLQVEDIELDLPASNKRAVLDAVSDRLSHKAGVEGSKILQALAAREQLGSTAINHGVAVPHARLDMVTSPAAVFTRLERPIDFDVMDGRPVDLVFAVIWPTENTDDFLTTLAQFCRLLREPRVLQWLREAQSAREARAHLCFAAEQASFSDKRVSMAGSKVSSRPSL